VPLTASKPDDPAGGPLAYTGAEITTADVACEGEIYTFEAAAGKSDELQKHTCLVMGIAPVFGTETFYRVDFANVDGETGDPVYLALTRNHPYAVKYN
jgi:hypothetical protein